MKYKAFHIDKVYILIFVDHLVFCRIFETACWPVRWYHSFHQFVDCINTSIFTIKFEYKFGQRKFWFWNNKNSFISSCRANTPFDNLKVNLHCTLIHIILRLLVRFRVRVANITLLHLSPF